MTRLTAEDFDDIISDMLREEGEETEEGKEEEGGEEKKEEEVEEKEEKEEEEERKKRKNTNNKKTQLTFAECLLCSSHCFQHFGDIVLINFPDNSKRLALYLPSQYRAGNGS